MRGGLHMLGAVSPEDLGEGIGASFTNPYGGLFGGILQTAGALTEGVVSTVESSEQEKKTGLADEAKAQASTTADAAAALAIANSLTSDELAAGAVGKAKAGAEAKAKSAKTAMNAAVAAVVSASASLSAQQSADRLKAISDAQSAAAAKAKKDPANLFNKNLVRAWDKVSSIAGGSAAQAAPDSAISSRVEEAGILSTKLFGPVQLWHLGAGALALGLGLFLVRR